MHQTYSPREVEKIASVSAVKQRDLRRRGILASRNTEGHTKYSLPDLAFFMALNALSEQHVPISVAAEMANKAAVGIAALAIDYWMRYVNNKNDTVEPPTPKFHCFYFDTEDRLRDFETGNLTEAYQSQAVEHNNLISSSVVLDMRYLAALIVERVNKPLLVD